MIVSLDSSLISGKIFLKGIKKLIKNKTKQEHPQQQQNNKKPKHHKNPKHQTTMQQSEGPLKIKY